MSSPRQHTPGPWIAKPDEVLCGSEEICRAPLAVCLDGQRLAKLEAINSELLAAAKLAVEWAEQAPAPYRDWPHIVAARAAIARATGGNAL